MTLARSAAAAARLSLLAALLLGTVLPASAAETIAYTYDGQGRLVKVARSGTVNNGTSECYAYDTAGNRTTVSVATSAACSTGGGGGGGTVSFSISSNGPVTEGANSVFTITKTGTATTSLSVTYATANGTAVEPGDYTKKSPTALNFLTTDTTKTVSVTTINDTMVESAETFTMSLSSPTGGATLGTATATATINDNDSAGTCTGVSFSVNNASAVEADNLVFTVTKTGSTTSSCSVTYATANGTAAAPADFTALAATALTFSSVQTSAQVTVTTFSNGLNAEPDETMSVNLSAATGGATISDSQGVGTIYDDGLGGGGGCDPQCLGPASDSTSDQPTDSATTPDSTTVDPAPDATAPPPPGRS